MTTSRGVARLCLQGARSLSTTNATTAMIHQRGFAARAVAASATATNNDTAAAAAAAAASSNIVGAASSSSASTSSTIHAAREGFALRGSVGWAASRLHRHHHQLGVPHHHQRRHLHRIVSTVSSRGLVGSSLASSTSRVCDWLHQPGGGGTAAAARNPSGASRGLSSSNDEADENARFHKAADEMLGNLEDAVEMGEHGTYVINKQGPNRQIWMSSPVSGPLRYDYDADRKVWVYARDGHCLHDRLSEELTGMCGGELNLEGLNE